MATYVSVIIIESYLLMCARMLFFSILCTQFEPSITERLILLKPNQSNVSILCKESC